MKKNFANFSLLILFLLSALENAGWIRVPMSAAWALMAGLLISSFWIYRSITWNPKYLEYLYQPLQPGDLRRKARDYFDEQTPRVMELGFTRLADTRLSEEPFRHDVRIFQSRDGAVFASICSANDILCVSFSSVMEDGVKMETTSLSVPIDEYPERRDRMQWAIEPNADVYELYQLHLKTLEDYEAENAAARLVYSGEDFRELITYGHRLLWHWRKRRGLTEQEIPEAKLPEPAYSPREVAGMA